MNPQFDQTPGLPLPQPSAAGIQPAYSQPQGVAPAYPAGAMPQPSFPSSQPAASAVPAYVQPTYHQPAPPAQPLPAQETAPLTPEDSEAVLDDEWVAKARDIVARYKGDPYVQGRELSKLKAQYVKARYNKDVKVAEDRS